MIFFDADFRVRKQRWGEGVSGEVRRPDELGTCILKRIVFSNLLDVVPYSGALELVEKNAYFGKLWRLYLLSTYHVQCL